MTTALVARSPYPGLAPFSLDDAPFFFGRERESRLVRANLFANRLTVLYAASGVGKSSLLHAGVLPGLIGKADLPRPLIVTIFDRWWGESALGLKQALADRATQQLSLRPKSLPLAGRTLGDLVGLIGQSSSCDVMLLLDQFEDQLLADGEEADAFMRELAEAISDRDLPLNVLLAVREDAFARLDRLEERLPVVLSTALRLDRMDRAGAEAAIRRPLEHYNAVLDARDQVSIEDAVVHAVLAGARRVTPRRPAMAGDRPAADDTEAYETPILQLVLSHLWDEEQRSGSNVLRLSTLERLGGPEQVAREHLKRVLSKLSAREQELVAHLFYHLVTPGGRSIPYSAAELADYVGTPADQLEPLLDQLTQPEIRVLRHVPPLDGDSKPAYELFHDLLAESATEWGRHFLRGREIELAALLGVATAKGAGGYAKERPGAHLAAAFQQLADVGAFGPLRHASVLWVDDQPENNRYERSALERLGLRVTLSSSSADALMRLGRGHFDAVISDMDRPEGKRAGYDLLEAMRLNRDRTPVIFYNRAGGPEYKALAQRAGAVGSTSHPEELVGLVLRTLSASGRGGVRGRDYRQGRRW